MGDIYYLYESLEFRGMNRQTNIDMLTFQEERKKEKNVRLVLTLVYLHLKGERTKDDKFSHRDTETTEN